MELGQRIAAQLGPYVHLLLTGPELLISYFEWDESMD